jgi:DnaJ-class molecular chaperone
MRDKLTMPQKIFWAMFMLIGSIFIFMQFSEIEAHGGNLRLPVPLVFIYERLGKWGVFGVSIFIAASLFVEFPDHSNPKHIRQNNLDKGEDLRLHVTLDFDEIILGCNKTIKIQHLEHVENGEVILVTRELTFTVPPGIHSGVNFLLVGEGDASPNGDSGYLLIVFENLPSEGNGLRREGSNIISDLKITRTQAEQGDRVRLEKINGIIDVIIPPGTKNGDRLVIRDKGLPTFNSRECFKLLAGTCRGNHQNVVEKTGLDPFSPRIKGHHIVFVNISDSNL